MKHFLKPVATALRGKGPPTFVKRVGHAAGEGTACCKACAAIWLELSPMVRQWSLYQLPDSL